MNLINRQLQNIFITPLYISYLDDMSVCDKIYDVLCQDRDSGNGERYKETVWQSDQYLHEHPMMQSISQLILREVEQVYDAFRVKRDSVYINNMWGNISNPWNSHHAHIHQNSYFSGILYLKTPEGSGNTVFFNNDLSNKLIRPEYEEMTDYNCGVFNVTPEKGKLVIFPSWIPHGVSPSNHPSKLDEERSTLAFTTMFRANIKHHASSVIYS